MEQVEVESRMFFRIWAFAGTAGIGIVGIWLVFEAIKFESTYSLLYLGAGLLGMIYGLLTFSMIFPAFTKKAASSSALSKEKTGGCFPEKHPSISRISKA